MGRQKGFKMSEEQKQSISKSKKGKPKSPEHRKAISEAKKGRESHRIGKRWLVIDGRRIWFTREEYENILKIEEQRIEAIGWEGEHPNKGQTWREVNGKRVWMDVPEALSYDARLKNNLKNIY